MEVTGETCTLCLKYVQDTNFITLDETILGKLSFLQMDLDQTMEESESLCKECEKKIEHAFEFKSCLVNTESCLVPYLTNDRSQKINIRLIIEKDGPSTSKIEASVDKEVCRLCKKLVNTTSVISLAKVLKDDSIMDVFHGHIPEMDLEVTENPTVCITCHQSLSHFSTLIGSWSIAKSWNDNDEDMKEDYNDFKVEVKNEKLDDVSDSNTNSSSSMLDSENSVKTPNEIDINIKTESPPFTGDVFVSNKQIKKEEPESDTAIREVHLESEEVDIKDEEGYGTEQQTGIKEYTNLTTGPTFSCDECSFVAKKKLYLDKHILLHGSSDTVNVLKCDYCPYVTKSRSHLKSHKLVHKNMNEVKTYKCKDCSYLTIFKSNLKHHFVIHKKTSEVNLFKCDECSYVTKLKLSLKKHGLVHKNKHELKLFKCEECAYASKYKGDLVRHGLVHKNVNEINTFKCEQCSYIAKRKSNLKEHISLHHSKSELVKFSCDLCPYVTLRKQNLKTHSLTHKCLTEITTFRCEECSYVAKTNHHYQRHLLKHKSLSEVTTFKCHECPYESKQKYYLKQHLLTHRKRNETLMNHDKRLERSKNKQKRMPPKKSDLNNSRSREARRKRVERAQQSAEQIATRNAAQRLRTAKSRALKNSVTNVCDGLLRELERHENET